jgi:GST-like protein
MAGYTLYCGRGGGSLIVEAAFAFAGIPLEFIDLSWDEIRSDNSSLRAINPLAQVPTLLMPDGSVMTESAAMILHLADLNAEANLVPSPQHVQRSRFLRWLIFLVSAVYPTFTYGDASKRWLAGDEKAAGILRKSTDEHREMLWRYVEGQIEGPWFLDETWSALDLYLWPMTYWGPGRMWFRVQCPKLHRIGITMHDHPVCRQVLARNGLLDA